MKAETKGENMSDYYVLAYSYDDPENVETHHATSIEEAQSIVSGIWDRGDTWDAYISEANDLSTFDIAES